MTPTAGERYVRWGWVAGTDPASLAAALDDRIRLTHAAPCWFHLDAAGRVRPRPGLDPSRHRDWIANLRRRGIALLPAVCGMNDERGVVRAVLDRDAARRRALAEIAGLCRAGEFDGITLVCRGAFPEVRDAFSAFVEELAWVLRTGGARLALVAAAQVTDTAVAETPDPRVDPRGWLRACADSFDYRTLGVYADLFIVDTRDFPWRPRIEPGDDDGVRVEPGPGAVAPEGWLQSVIDHALLHVPARNLVLTLPLYGRAWAVDGGGPAGGVSRVVPLAEVERLPARATGLEDEPDPGAGGRRLSWVDDRGQRWVLYTDDAASLEAKAALIARHDLGGAAFWRLGFGTRSAWEAVDRGLALRAGPAR